MVGCAAVSCKSNSSHKTVELVSFYRLPHDLKLRKVWLVNLKRLHPPKEEHMRVCHLHFDENCFERDLKV